MRTARTPRTKEELVNKLMSYDFNGDIRTLGSGASVIRTKPHVVRLTFPDTGGVFDLTVHIPRDEHKASRLRAQGVDEWETKVAAPPPAQRKKANGSTRRPGRKQ